MGRGILHQCVIFCCLIRSVLLLIARPIVTVSAKKGIKIGGASWTVAISHPRFGRGEYSPIHRLVQFAFMFVSESQSQLGFDAFRPPRRSCGLVLSRQEKYRSRPVFCSGADYPMKSEDSEPIEKSRGGTSTVHTIGGRELQ